MSSTTTQTRTERTERTERTVLDDYALKHTGSTSLKASDASSTSSASSAATPQAPIAWDESHRRVPPYRPIQYERDVSEIRVYQNNIEATFVGTMFTGVFLNSTTAKITRAVFGDKFRNAPIGGEM